MLISFERAELGRTGLAVGRLGMGSSYGADARAVRLAFDSGVNYFYWGAVRRAGFGQGLRELSAQRSRFLLVLQSFSRVPQLVGWGVERGLRRLGFDHADVLLLGWWNGPVGSGILDAALMLRERGLVRHLGFSTHNRPLVPAAADPLDIAHVRYNAEHPGAENDVFPRLGPPELRPGVVAFTATSWGRLLARRRVPPSLAAPTAGDCYRFVLSNPAVDVCLTGPGNEAQLAEALAGWRRGPMDEDEIAWMRQVGKAVRGG
ncbi:MAG: aldo/keto reductase [Acidobacteria bacterium]|nr:aldo/keto reductase [Acidobacteriota bacterium]